MSRRDEASSVILVCVLLLSAAAAFDVNPFSWFEPGPLFSKKNLYRLSALTDITRGATTNRPPFGLGRGINGGLPCGGCTVVLGMTEQLSQIYNETTGATMERMCNYLPVKYQGGCKLVAKYVAPFIIGELGYHTSPDTICYGLRVCYADPDKKMCHLFPLPSSMNEVHQEWTAKTLEVPKEFLKAAKDHGRNWPWLCYIPGVWHLCEAFDDVYDQLVPAVDLDGDRFSPTETLRGSIWRGRDCGDLKSDFYPGRRALLGDVDHDSNCNGIYGINKSTGISFEEELCGGSGQRGIIYIGDSVGAHFHAPPKWFTPKDLSSNILQNMSYVISNEFDWPHLGFATGFRNTTMPKLIEGFTDSVYLRLRERNLCNHRDYQEFVKLELFRFTINLARNGANSFTTDSYKLSMARKKLSDHPAIVFYSLIGNDVCNSVTDTLAEMTSPEVFYNNTLDTLKYLETHLPPNSHVILIGLIDGGIIYDAMAHRIHPLGELNGDVKNTDVYEWFNCMEIGPCHGWMSTNQTLRRLTTKRARQLTRVLKDMAAKLKFDSFDLHFTENPFKTVITEWLDAGGELWELIEPVDSLHPTQAAQPLIAKTFWKIMEKQMPNVLGPVNNRNKKIRNLFGDQNGH